LELYLGGFLMVWLGTVNLIWYLAKQLAHSQGLPVCWLGNHLLEFPNMRKLMREGATREIRRKAGIFFYALVLGPIVPVIIFIMVLIAVRVSS